VSQRMPEVEFRRIADGGPAHPSDEQDMCDEAQRARSEEARLLEEARKKDATIKALADVLEQVWNMSDNKTAPLWPQVEAALRLTGRLK